MPFDIELMRDLRPGNRFYYFASLPSTMTEATRLIESGESAGAVVIADEQTAGIGRLGRSWISDRDAGIYASIILSFQLAPGKLPVASLLLGLAVAEAIQKATHIVCDLRWPNDVLVEGRKIAGILPQLSGRFLVGGIGINVENRSFPVDLRTPATSLFLAGGGRSQSREKVLAAVLECIDNFSELLTNHGPAAIIRTFSAASSYVVNRRIVVEESGARGITAGLDESGFLLLRLDTGATQRISSGGIRPDWNAAP